MVTVYTKAELEAAIRNRETKIIVRGELAEKFKKKRRAKKGALIGGAAMIIAGLAAIPFTGGASAAGIAAGAAGLTIGALTISAAELAIIVGGAVAITAIVKGAKVTFNPDGSVTVEPTYK